MCCRCAAGASAVADGGILALLQFAEQYQEKAKPAPAENPAITPEPRPQGERKMPAATAQKPALSAAATKTLRAQETQLRAQQATIAQLQQ